MGRNRPPERHASERWSTANPATPHEDLRCATQEGSLVSDAIDAVLDSGAAMVLSRTSQGGALCIRILEGQTNTPLYAGTPTELRSLLTGLIQAAHTG
jgi:hypothetical protein